MQTDSEPSQLELFADAPFSLRLTIEDALRIFWDNYWQHVACAKTTQAHFRRIREFFKGFYLDTISKADVERFRRHLKQAGYHDATINKAHMILSRLFSKMEEYKEGRFVNGTDFSRIMIPAKNPASQVPKIRETQFARKVVLSPEQVKRLASCGDEDFKEMVYCLYWTRLRPSDFFRVTSLNIDFKAMIITGIQRKTVTTTNPSGVPYKVAFGQGVGGLLQRRAEAVKSGMPLFKKTNFRLRWETARTAAGMPHVQVRDLRRSAASYLLDKGVDAQTVAEGLGHTTLRMLPTYTPRTHKHLVEATEKLVEV